MAEEFGAWDANCSVCNGTGWMPKKGDPKKDAKVAKLFGLSIDELTLTPCNAGGKSMGCWSSKNRNRLRRLQRAEEFGAEEFGAESPIVAFRYKDDSPAHVCSGRGYTNTTRCGQNVNWDRIHYPYHLNESRIVETLDSVDNKGMITFGPSARKRICLRCYRSAAQDFDAEEFGAEGKVRTMSGKPHTPRKLVKDKNITPKEAAKRMKLEADEGTYYDEGRSAAKMVFMPEMKDRESFGLMDSEYMIQFNLKPDELIAEMENGSSRYNQFSWGWGQEWDKLTSEYMLNPDEYSNESYQDDDFYNQSAEDFEGEWVGVAPFQEYFPDEKEVVTWFGLVTLACATIFGYEAYRNKFAKNAETFGASEACSEDADCPEGKVCVDGKCLTICVDDGDCPSWMECRDDLHPTEKVCGEDKSDSDENPFADLINRRTDEDENPNDAPSNTKDTYSTTTKALFGVGIVGAIGIGIKVLGGMQDGGE